MRPHVEKVLCGEYDLPANLELMEAPKTVLDIGANVGAFTAWALAQWPDARVEAFEPVPQNFEVFLQNHDPDSRVSLGTYAVMSFTADSLVMYRGERNPGACAAFDNGEQKVTDTFRVPAIAACALPPCEFIKIDAEGAETQILRELDLSKAKVIAYEWHGNDRRIECEELINEREGHCFELVRETVLEHERGICVWALEGAVRPRVPQAYVPGTPKKVMLGLPVYGGYDPHFITSLMEFLIHRIPVGTAIKTCIGDSLVSRARNRIAAAFLRSDCTHLLFLDTDLIFSPEHIARLVSHNEPIVAGLYPKKQRELGWVCNLLPGVEMDERGLKPVRYAGTGCLLIAREVLEAMIVRWPEIEYDPDDGDEAGVKWDLFPTGVHVCPETGRRRYLSEDWWFCQRALELGYTVWMDTQVILKHVGPMVYPVDSLEGFTDPVPDSDCHE